MSVIDVAKAASRAVEDIHSSGAPLFLECLTYRFRAHSMFDAELYRDKEEVQESKKRDPLTVLQNTLQEMNLWSKINLQKVEKEITSTIYEVVEFAENGTLEPLEDLEKFVYSSSEVQNG